MRATILITADIDEVRGIQQRLRDSGLTALDRVAGIYDLIAVFDFETVGRLKFQIMEVIRQDRPNAGNVDRTVTLLHLDLDDTGEVVPTSAAKRATILVTARAGRVLDAQERLRRAGASRVSLVTGIYDLIAVIDREDEKAIEEWARDIRREGSIERTVTLIQLPDIAGLVR